MTPLEKIIEPYQTRLANIKFDKDGNATEKDCFLFSKWAWRVEKGWYGFSLGAIPWAWTYIINDFLKALEPAAPDFKIHQIKLKFGGLRFYVDLKLEDPKEIEAIHAEISKLENLLQSGDLIY